MPATFMYKSKKADDQLSRPTILKQVHSSEDMIKKLILHALGIKRIKLPKVCSLPHPTHAI